MTQQNDYQVLLLPSMPQSSPYCYTSCYWFSCHWGDALQEAQSSITSNWIGMKCGRIVLQVNTHQLRDFSFDKTLSRWRPRRHFVHFIWWVHTVSARHICSSIHKLPANTSVYSSWSIVHLDLLIFAQPANFCKPYSRFGQVTVGELQRIVEAALLQARWPSNHPKTALKHRMDWTGSNKRKTKNQQYALNRVWLADTKSGQELHCCKWSEKEYW